MSIDEFRTQNIEKVDVEEKVNGRMYLIEAKNGYYILIPENLTTDDDGYVHRLLKKAVLLQDWYEFDKIEILTNDDVREGDNIETVKQPDKNAKFTSTNIQFTLKKNIESEAKNE